MGRDEKIPLPPPRQPFLDTRLPTPGQSIAGVDGCKSGWVMVRRDEKGRFDEPVIAKSLDELPPTGVVLIDIPIGLPDSGRRACDLAAKKKLGRRHCTVFTGARRPLLSMTSRESAHAWGKERDGLGVTMQMWAIVCKIRELDAWITRERNRTFREGHPELSFCAAAQRPMEHKKSQAAGRKERLDVLASFIDRAMVVEWLHPKRRSGAAKDDILDALALCWSAARLALGCHCTLPTDPPRDCRDLPMEIVC